MKLFFMITLILLSGCAHTVSEPTLNSTNIPCFKGIFKSAHRFEKNEKRHLKKSVKQKKISQSAKKFTEGFVTFRYDPEQQPIIQTEPFQETVIRLEEGEKFTNISSGDPSRWSYAVAVSGKDDNAQQNILVKPSLPDISTNLVITTDKRLYNLQLVSTKTDPLTRSVNFIYPEVSIKSEEDHELAKNTSVESIENRDSNPQLQFNYSITTAGLFSQSPSWKPVRVIDDGAHTYIQFPESIAYHDLPALFVIQNRQKICVNYRFQSPYMMLDKLFSEATLVSGVGSLQQVVIITHRD